MEFEHTIAATGGPDGAPSAVEEPAELERGATVGRFVLLGTLGARALYERSLAIWEKALGPQDVRAQGLTSLP